MSLAFFDTASRDDLSPSLLVPYSAPMYSRLEVSDKEIGSAFSSPGEVFSEAADGAFFSGLLQPVSFYFLRHGRSEGNASMTFQGRLDYPLDELGRRQAKAAAAWFSDKKIDSLLTSPLRRARETAAELGSAVHREPSALPSLIEVDVGIFSGIPAALAESRHPEVYREFEYRSWDAVPGAEGSAAMYARAMASWRKLRELALGGARTIVCVAHGGTLQWLIRSTFGVRTWLPLMPTANCGISQFDVEPTGPGCPAFTQWTKINFVASSVESGTKPVF